MDMTEVLETLQRLKGKIEIKFSESDNAKVSAVCLVFIKIPIKGDRINIIQDMIATKVKPPLTKGRFDVQNASKKGGMFVGIVRVVDMQKLGETAFSIASRMEITIQQSSGQDITRWRQNNATGSNIFGV